MPSMAPASFIGGGESSSNEFGALNYTQIADYRFGKVLGQGAYAVVKEA